MKMKYDKNAVAWLFSLLCLIIGGETAMAQVRTTGMVTDSITLAPIEGVTVTRQGTTSSTQTDEHGHFNINASPGDMLIFSSVGYYQKSVTVTGSSMRVWLSPTSEVLEEVYVVSYGTQKKREITGAVAQVDARQ